MPLNYKLAFVTKLPSIPHIQVLVSIDSRNGLTPFGFKPFLDSMLTYYVVHIRLTNFKALGTVKYIQMKPKW